MTLDEFNKLDSLAARSELLKCCGSVKWASSIAAYFPFSSKKELLKKAAFIWKKQCSKADWLEAFAHHPKIGETKNLDKKFLSTIDWASAEQAGIKDADEDVIRALAKANKEYENKFGFIFIVCATGKSAQQMLELLKKRIVNEYEDELQIAQNEQSKITEIRLHKLLS